MQRDPGYITELLKKKASAPNSAIPRSFLRWAGSKKHRLTDLQRWLPPRFNVYFEPFLGGASLFFLLEPSRAVISDKCHALIDTYAALRDNCTAVWRYLEPLVPDRETYYEIRRSMSRGRYKRAAQFIYMNKSCWNGLYRVNSSGQFNVPYGRPKSDYLVDKDNLSACSQALSQEGVSIFAADFEKALGRVASGDFVYLDPPYVTGHRNNGFVDYNETLFSWADQIRLAELADRMRRQGAYVLVTNADHDEVRALYSRFYCTRIHRYSTLASERHHRRPVSEAVFVGYDPPND